MDVNISQTATEATGFATIAWAWSVAFLPRLGAALLILVIGFIVARWAQRLVRAAIGRMSHVDGTLQPIAGTAARYAVLIVVLVVALGQLGVQTTSLLAVLGAAGLAIGLALQGTLTNIAAGIMLLYLRPFRTGDTIETANLTGKVKEVGLFVTHLETPEGVFLFVPNSALWNVPLKNQTRNALRLLVLQMSVGYSADLAEVRRVLTEMAESDERVLKEPAPTVSVETYMDNRIVVALRAWVKAHEFGDVQRRLAEEAKRRLEAAGVRIPQ